MARIYTLATLMLVIGIYNIFPTVMPSDSWFNHDVWIAWGAVNFALTVPYLFWYTWQLQSNKAFIYFRRGPARQEFLAAHRQTLAEIHTRTVSLDAATDPAIATSGSDRRARSTAEVHR